MSISKSILEVSPLILAFGSAIFSSFYEMSKKWQDFVLGLLGFLSAFFVGMFFFYSSESTHGNYSLIEVGFDKFSLFLGSIYCVSLFIGLFPIRKENSLSSTFLYYVACGLGLIISNNLFTFALFLTVQRAIPTYKFLKAMKNDQASGGGTFILQHILTFFCLVAIVVLATMEGYATVPFSEIPGSFFTWPILILSFVIIYEAHGIFPFHSWIHDLVGNLPWYEISSIFLARAGVVLFVKFLLPTINQDPDGFRILLLSLSIFSSIYWTIRGIFETTVTKTTTYFYVAQASLILTGLQADMVAARGAYMHLMVISLSATAIWSIVSYVQHYTSIKRLNQFYGLAQFYPKLSTLFCAFGFCMIGVPLGASFVVEDLVITGLLAQKPYLGLGHILATCLNGILFFLVFSKIFLGQTSFPQKVKNYDMTWSQMLPYTLALILMVMIGICPFLFLEKFQW